jgi:hypothetical protein
MSDRGRAELNALPRVRRELDDQNENYPVPYSERCRAALDEVDARLGGWGA